MIETIAAPTVAEPTTPIKPSEALRLGRLIRPERSTGKLFAGDSAACALGAIKVGFGEPPNEDYTGVLFDMLSGKSHCPDSKCTQYASEAAALYSLVWHLNDGHEWSDNQIAGWLEGLGL